MSIHYDAAIDREPAAKLRAKNLKPVRVSGANHRGWRARMKGMFHKIKTSWTGFEF
jgi:hypothetical protein